jgi:hypothetical protein
LARIDDEDEDDSGGHDDSTDFTSDSMPGRRMRVVGRCAAAFFSRGFEEEAWLSIARKFGIRMAFCSQDRTPCIVFEDRSVDRSTESKVSTR